MSITGNPKKQKISIQMALRGEFYTLDRDLELLIGILERITVVLEILQQPTIGVNLVGLNMFLV